MMIGPQGADCLGLGLAANGGEGLTARHSTAWLEAVLAGNRVQLAVFVS
jgi:hypothetical protein